MSVCTRCGTQASPQSQFCAACGQPLVGQAPQAPAVQAPVYTPPPAYERPVYGSTPQPPAYAPPPMQQGYGASMPVPPNAIPFDPTAYRVHWSHDSLRGFLVSYGTGGRGEFWPMFGGRYPIGRISSGETPEIVVPDGTISSRHAVISVDGTSGVITVDDLRSTNGTFVNEDPVIAGRPRELRDGDRVRFGGYTTVIKVITKV